jgi:hypothetical protein
MPPSQQNRFINPSPTLVAFNIIVDQEHKLRSPQIPQRATEQPEAHAEQNRGPEVIHPLEETRHIGAVIVVVHGIKELKHSLLFFRLNENII